MRLYIPYFSWANPEGGQWMSDREKAIDLALSQIEKQFGKGAIMRLGNEEPLPDVAAIPTGSLSLDLALGVRTDDLLVSQPDTGEQALEITEMLVRSGAIDVLVIDSVAALVPKAEIEGEMGDAHMGLQARLMSQAL